MVEVLQHPGVMARGARPGITTLSPFDTAEKTEAWQRKATCCCAETVRAKSLKILHALWSRPSDNAREGINTCQYDSR